jgi:hypothetical protein
VYRLGQNRAGNARLQISSRVAVARSPRFRALSTGPGRPIAEGPRSFDGPRQYSLASRDHDDGGSIAGRLTVSRTITTGAGQRTVQFGTSGTARQRRPIADGIARAPVSDLNGQSQKTQWQFPALVKFDQLFSFGCAHLIHHRSRSNATQRRGSSPSLKARRMILIKNGLWIADNSQATNLTDEKPCPTRTDVARQVAEEYASDLREIINKLRKKLN